MSEKTPQSIPEDTTHILTKIKKLLTLSTSSNPNEAAAAAAKAQSLLMQYNLTLRQVETTDSQASEYGTVPVDTGSRVWRRHLLTVIAKTNFCEVVYSSGNMRSTVIGQTHNQEVVLEMYRSLIAQLEAMATTAYRQSGSDMHIKSWTDSFYMGAVESIWQRLEAQKREMVAHSNECRALILTNDAELQEAVNRMFPQVRRGQQKRIRNADGYYSGREAGSRVALNKTIPASF